MIHYGRFVRQEPAFHVRSIVSTVAAAVVIVVGTPASVSAHIDPDPVEAPAESERWVGFDLATDVSTGELDEPAPAMVLTAAAPTTTGPLTTPSDPATTSTAATLPDTGTDDPSRGLWVLLGAMLGVGMIAGLAYRQSRRSTR
jgi:hypothetical protein